MWADVLYACDGKWWREYGGAPDFNGLKVSQDAGISEEYGEIRRVVLEPGNDLQYRQGFVGSGGNSGFQALNFTVLTGAKRILLLGFDMHGEHWHGRHSGALHNPNAQGLLNWIQAFNHAAPQIKQFGVLVINCTPGSSLGCFEKAGLGCVLND